MFLRIVLLVGLIVSAMSCTDSKEAKREKDIKRYHSIMETLTTDNKYLTDDRIKELVSEARLLKMLHKIEDSRLK